MRSQKERTLFIFAVIFSSLVWVALVVSLVGLLYAPFVALAVVVGHAFLLARLTGNAIRVGSRQLPDLYRKVESIAKKLGMSEVPEVYVVSGGGVLNAFATKLFSRRFIILHSEILDACELLDEKSEPGAAPSAVDFIIGHEIGHLALGHLSWNWLLWPAKLVPLMGPAYSRACEYSADACGYAAVGDVETASRALAVLAAGGRQARHVSLEGLLEQRHETAGFVMGLVELNSTHPYLSKRVAAIHCLKDAGIAPDVGRNPMSYVMAPFFGFAAGGVASLATMYMYVAVIGILAAIAIPNFQKFQERSKEAALLEQQAQAQAPQDPIDNAFAPPPSQQADLLGALATPPPSNVFGNLDGNGLNANALDANANAGGLGIGGLGSIGVGGLGTVAHDDDDDSAAAADDPPAPRFEARSWLKGQIVAKNPEAIANKKTGEAAVLVEKLYKAGATKVYVSDVGVDTQGVYANDIIAEMPAKPALRKKLIDVCTAEFKKQGYDEPCEDEGAEDTTELYFNWQ